MRPYFEKMTALGKALPQSKIKESDENVAQIRAIMEEIDQEREKAMAAGLPAKKINERGQLTVFQRLDCLLDPGTWCPLHSIFNPKDNEEGTTSVVDGLAK
ncbi:MAG: glutaconyl-CoA decarboxylase subunit alpha, partial [Deltaproteobacteria bacterium]|nr:glutaconyl-CoA decarboxylase subunit alpha [Deltaproteobacteria bacterium]